MSMQSTAKAPPNEEDEDEMEDVEELRKGGFLGGGDEASPLMKGRPKLEAKAGDRRIKRTIVFLGPDGSRQSRTIIYSDRDKVGSVDCHSKACFVIRQSVRALNQDLEDELSSVALERSAVSEICHHGYFLGAKQCARLCLQLEVLSLFQIDLKQITQNFEVS